MINILRFVLKLLRIEHLVRGYKIGHKTTELGLSLGQSVIAFGKIVFDKKTHEI